MTRVERLAAMIEEWRSLLEEARQTHDWETFIGRESRMRARLEALMAEPVGTAEADAVRVALQELLALNHQAVRAVEERQAEVAAGLQHVARVRRAAQAYEHTASA